jgi:ABC-type transport system involved in cytochrome c biogenesis permease component
LAGKYPTPDDDQPERESPERDGWLWRVSLIAEVRAARRDPFYRTEMRQPTNVAMVLVAAGSAALFSVLLSPFGIFCCFVMLPVVIGFPAMVFPGILAAEGLFHEFDNGTVEQLLLTPADRGRILWAKFAARLRPMFYIAMVAAIVFGFVLLLFVSGAGIDVPGLIEGSADLEGWRVAVFLPLGLLIGLVVGALVGLLVLGQSATGGALATYSVLSARKRSASYFLLMATAGGICLVESVAGGIIMGFGGVFMALMAEAGRDVESVVAVIAVFLGVCATLVLRMVLVNWLIPVWVMRHCARTMDSALLRGR